MSLDLHDETHPSHRPVGTDNNDTVFQFDLSEEPTIEALAGRNIHVLASLSPASGDMSPSNPRADSVVDTKGKGVSNPIDIPSSSSRTPEASSSSSSASIHVHNQDASGSASSSQNAATYSNTEKGKGKISDSPPILPPLAFTHPEFSYSHISWPSPSSFTDSEVGTSSYGSPPMEGSTSRFSVPEHSPCTTSPPSSSRARTLSDSSTQSDTSIATLSLSRVKVKSGSASRAPGNLSRKLLFRKLGPSPASGVSVEVTGLQSEVFQTHLGSESALKDVSYSYRLSGHDGTQSLSWPATPFPKGKGRSNSSPLPQPIFPNHFDEMPKEIRIRVLAALLDAHESDHHKLTSGPLWSTSKASSSKNKWIGRDKGARELVKLSRVSKCWQMLVSDGQLWKSLDLRAFHNIPKSVILRLTSVSGPFIQSLDISGHVFMLPTTLLEITNRLCIQPSASVFGTAIHTQLTKLNVRGCTMLTTHSLHHILRSSPAVEILCVKGLSIVTNMTCEVLSAHCPRLRVLDMSRCPNMDANGIRSIVKAALWRKQTLPWRILRLSGLKYVDDALLSALGKVTPFLEVLDLSYCRQLHNSALEAFVACDDGDTEEKLGVPIITLTGRQAGRDIGDYNKYRRRVTRLRHLCLSFCFLLTDHACSNIAHSVPQLEFLEMAGIGDDLKDGGLIRLFETTPMIRRVDLEDSSELTDALIASLTPAQVEDDVPADSPQPGHALEQLVISYAGNLTDNALLALIRGCANLKVLEADNTRIGPKVFKEFIRLCRARSMSNSKIVAVDCRTIGESSVRDMASLTRPRMGWRAYEARKLKYLDARDGDLDDLKIGQDECDDKRVVVKTFYSWQTVDSVKAAREKRKKSTSRRAANGSDNSVEAASSGSTRWWSPGGRRSGTASPVEMTNRDSCTIM
ncbi:RNI-like protein [Hymenopellis radicata]|nr:RNI-like protein [Hymenopellis radicata]